MDDVPSGADACSLERTIREGRFFILDDETIMKQIYDAFPSEIDRLRNAYAVREPGSPPKHGVDNKPRPKPPSELLYGVNYDEVNRTLVGVRTLRWIYQNDYDSLTRGQPEQVRLERDSFDWLRQLFESNIHSPEDLLTLVMSMVINDLGKDPNLEVDYQQETGLSLKGQNHDIILLEAAKAGMIPCLGMLDVDHREEVMRGLELGGELNAAQLAQAENVPVNLEGLLGMRGHEHAFELKFMEQILDVAGAGGHADPTSAKKLIEPVFQAFKTVHEISLEIIAGKSTLRQGYDKVLTKRGNMLVREGFRRLTVGDRDQRALLRLLTMGRTADKEQAELFDEAFEGLDVDYKTLLVDGLNVDGDTDGTAVLPYYMPAMLSEGLDSTKDMPKEDRIMALRALMRYLARVLEHTPNPEAEDEIQFDFNAGFGDDDDDDGEEGEEEEDGGASYSDAVNGDDKDTDRIGSSGSAEGDHPNAHLSPISCSAPQPDSHRNLTINTTFADVDFSGGRSSNKNTAVGTEGDGNDDENKLDPGLGPPTTTVTTSTSSTTMRPSMRRRARTTARTPISPSPMPTPLSASPNRRATTAPVTSSPYVIERNVMTKLRETISRPEFRENPSVLDSLEIPKGEKMRRRRTSLSGLSTVSTTSSMTGGGGRDRSRSREPMPGAHGDGHAHAHVHPQGHGTGLMPGGERRSSLR